ncbi:hypothetical protein PDIG_70600 [Penicillium digitatum PHI26]|uniref:Uncharacterized protein n=2 Tax=Penicillium digitatum TaxID=36651 RepID=K9FFL1_PEND2|nr:hypothetical protein PDIP_79910 [Penicillium digitatum Pd1]EKV06366.1 hypothetical protein PDIP_79910 [Penicillium digitatum Pd1]EKV07984.1 hypothetical protein PDIG_70600 [Penicillium digitatum PHI26]
MSPAKHSPTPQHIDNHRSSSTARLLLPCRETARPLATFGLLQALRFSNETTK